MTHKRFLALNPYEQELLTSAMEETYLVEFRNGCDSVPSTDIKTYRVALEKALLALCEARLIELSLAKWNPSDQPAKNIDLQTLQHLITAGTIWDETAEELLLLEASAKGERIYRGENE